MERGDSAQSIAAGAVIARRARADREPEAQLSVVLPASVVRAVKITAAESGETLWAGSRSRIAKSLIGGRRRTGDAGADSRLDCAALFRQSTTRSFETPPRSTWVNVKLTPLA
jgi:hypothetical protein